LDADQGPLQMGDWDVEAAGVLMRHLDEQRVKEYLYAGGDLTRVRVRQATGTWHSGADVVERFRELDRSGFYLQLDQQAYGPFTLSRFRTHLLEIARQAQADVEFQVRQGVDGPWQTVRTSQLTAAIDLAIEQFCGAAEASVGRAPMPEHHTKHRKKPKSPRKDGEPRVEQKIRDYLLTRRRKAEPVTVVAEEQAEPLEICDYCGLEIAQGLSVCPHCNSVRKRHIVGDSWDMDERGEHRPWLSKIQAALTLTLFGLALLAWWQNSGTDHPTIGGSQSFFDQLARLPGNIYDFVTGAGVQSPRARGDLMSQLHERLVALSGAGQSVELDELRQSTGGEELWMQYRQLRDSGSRLHLFDGVPAAEILADDIVETEPSIGETWLHIGRISQVPIAVITTRFPDRFAGPQTDTDPSQRSITTDQKIGEVRAIHPYAATRQRIRAVNKEFRDQLAGEWDHAGPRMLEQLLNGQTEIQFLPDYSGSASGTLIVGLRAARNGEELILQTVFCPVAE
jgi:hypothetical protein